MLLTQWLNVSLRFAVGDDIEIYLMMFRSHRGHLWLCVPHLFLCLSRKPFDSVVLASAVCRGVFYMQ